jgi:hypothetical protein
MASTPTGASTGGMAGYNQAALHLLEIIGRLWGRQDAERMALIEYELCSCLQFLARGNSRCFDSTDQVRYVVADLGFGRGLRVVIMPQQDQQVQCVTVAPVIEPMPIIA